MLFDVGLRLQGQLGIHPVDGLPDRDRHDPRVELAAVPGALTVAQLVHSSLASLSSGGQPGDAPVAPGHLRRLASDAVNTRLVHHDEVNMHIDRY